MKTIRWITLLFYLPVNAVLFGAFAILTLMAPVPPNFLPVAIIGAVIVAGIVSYPVARALAPRARARYWRRKGEPAKAVWD